jgi:uncharacterized protein YndB with AHSA1/START domain
MPNIRHEILIGASAEEVYHAVSSQESLSAWWTPGTKIKAEVNSIAYFGFGPEYVKQMKITELVAFEKVKWFCIAGAEEWIGTTITFELHPGNKESLLNTHPELRDQLHQEKSDKGTLLVFCHDDWRRYTSMFAECNYTWARFLWSLKLFCETGKGLPWPNQHRVNFAAIS